MKKKEIGGSQNIYFTTFLKKVTSVKEAEKSALVLSLRIIYIIIAMEIRQRNVLLKYRSLTNILLSANIFVSK